MEHEFLMCFVNDRKLREQDSWLGEEAAKKSDPDHPVSCLTCLGHYTELQTHLYFRLVRLRR